MSKILVFPISWIIRKLIRRKYHFDAERNSENTFIELLFFRLRLVDLLNIDKFKLIILTKDGDRYLLKESEVNIDRENDIVSIKWSTNVKRDVTILRFVVVNENNIPINWKDVYINFVRSDTINFTYNLRGEYNE